MNVGKKRADAVRFSGDIFFCHTAYFAAVSYALKKWTFVDLCDNEALGGFLIIMVGRDLLPSWWDSIECEIHTFSSHAS